MADFKGLALQYVLADEAATRQDVTARTAEGKWSLVRLVLMTVVTNKKILKSSRMLLSRAQRY